MKGAQIPAKEDGPVPPARAEPKVHVFHVGEERSVEESNVLQALTADQKRAPGNVIHGPGLAPPRPVGLLVAEQRGEVLAEVQAPPRAPPPTRIVVEEDSRSGHADPRPRTERLLELREAGRSGVEAEVIVHEEHGLCPFVQRQLCALIRGLTEPQVVAVVEVNQPRHRGRDLLP